MIVRASLMFAAFERARMSRISLNDRNTHISRSNGCVGAKIYLDDHNALSHLVKSLRYAIAQVTQTDQDNMVVHSGGNSHFPLLASCTAVEQQDAKIGQPVREDNDADERHEKVKDLQTKIFRKLSDWLEECRGEDDIDRFGETMNWCTDKVCDRGISRPAADHGHGKEQQWRFEIPSRESECRATLLSIAGSGWQLAS